MVLSISTLFWVYNVYSSKKSFSRNLNIFLSDYRKIEKFQPQCTSSKNIHRSRRSVRVGGHSVRDVLVEQLPGVGVLAFEESRRYFLPVLGNVVLVVIRLNSNH